jgi:flagellar biosynthesis protein FlhF
MKIRRFYSHNVRSALKQVTETFGDDAAILSNKKVEGGVEIIAALDYDESLMPPKEFLLEKTNATTNPDAVARSQQGARGQNTKASSTSATGDTKQDYDDSTENFSSQLTGSGQNNHSNQSFSAQTEQDSALAKLLHSQSHSLHSNSTQATANQADSYARAQMPNLEQASLKSGRGSHSRLEWSMDPSLQAMREELVLMRSMMTEQLKGLSWERFGEKDPLAAMIIRRLTELGLNNASVESLLPFIDREQDAECCWQKVLANFAKSLPMSNNDLIENGGTYAFVGPTGVGKTTTIAKLAARYVIKHGNNSIALISTDNQRISAQEQLTTFGRILNVPTASVNKQNNLACLLKKFANKKLVLIDTAGISGQDAELSLAQLKTINQSQTAIKKILLMSATSQAAVLEQSLQLFQSLTPSALILTKLDEAVSLGELLSVVLKAQYPVIYTTDGQKVPEDIRLARSHHLVSKAVWLSNKFSRQSHEWQLAQSFAQAKTA